MATSKISNARPKTIAYEENWVASFSEVLKQGVFIFLGTRFGEMTLITVFSNGTMAQRSLVSGSTNWTFSMENFILSGTIATVSGYAIIALN